MSAAAWPPSPEIRNSREKGVSRARVIGASVPVNGLRIYGRAYTRPGIITSTPGQDIYTHDLANSPHPVITYARSKNYRETRVSLYALVILP